MQAFAALVERYGAQVLVVLEGRLRDRHRADDLAQDVWIRVFRSLRSFRPDGAFRPWLFAIALNRLRDEHRERATERARTLGDVAPRDVFAGRAAPRRDEPTGRLDEAQAIEAALALVPEPFRAALQLVDVLGLDHHEAAQAIGCAVGTAKSRVHRGRMHFREHYERLCRAPAEREALQPGTTRRERGIT